MYVEVMSPSGGSGVRLNLPSAPGIFDVPFSSFSLPFPYVASNRVDFRDVGFIELHFEMSGGDSVTIDRITAVPEPSCITLLALAGVVLLRTRLLCPHNH